MFFFALDPIEFIIITELAYSRLDPDVASFYSIKVYAFGMHMECRYLTLTRNRDRPGANVIKLFTVVSYEFS